MNADQRIKIELGNLIVQLSVAMARIEELEKELATFKGDERKEVAAD